MFTYIIHMKIKAAKGTGYTVTTSPTGVYLRHKKLQKKIWKIEFSQMITGSSRTRTSTRARTRKYENKIIFMKYFIPGPFRVFCHGQGP
jgi:hypothetical protein